MFQKIGLNAIDAIHRTSGDSPVVRERSKSREKSCRMVGTCDSICSNVDWTLSNVCCEMYDFNCDESVGEIVLIICTLMTW